MPRIEPIPYEQLNRQLRDRLDKGLSDKRYSGSIPFRISAHAPSAAEAADEWYLRTFNKGLLDLRLQELLRLCSAQLNGCAQCMISRKDANMPESDVSGLYADPNAGSYSERERRALNFLHLMSVDHQAIDDRTFRKLAEVFSAGEIVEIGLFCAHVIGRHRWLHALDVLGQSAPIIPYSRTEGDARASAGA